MLVRSQKGQGITEYIIITILVALIVLFAIQRFGGVLRNRFGNMIGSVSSVNVVDTADQQIQGQINPDVNDTIDTAQDGTNPSLVVSN